MRPFMELLARGMAILGGIVLSLLILMTCVSIAGRVLNTMLHGWIGDLAPGFAAQMLDLGIGPINGDFEIVEAGVAFAIFAFLPLCQLVSGHADVDILVSKFSPRAQSILRCVVEWVFAAALVLIAVQLFGGMMSKMRFGENTFILQFPVWWGYAASLVAAAVAALVGIYTAFLHLRALIAGEEVDL